MGRTVLLERKVAQAGEKIRLIKTHFYEYDWER